MIIARNLHCSQHARHVGTCPACQRARLSGSKQQLAEVVAITAAVKDSGRRPEVSAGIRAAAGDGAPSPASVPNQTRTRTDSLNDEHR